VSRKFVVATAARPAEYDRNPATKLNNYLSTAVAPHASTSRWSYTVPAAKKSKIGHGQANLLRDVASGTPGVAVAYINITPSGGAASTLAYSTGTAGGANTGQNTVVGGGQYLEAGDSAEAKSADPSTGGSYVIALLMTITEFDE